MIIDGDSQLLMGWARAAHYPSEMVLLAHTVVVRFITHQWFNEPGEDYRH
jgi:hypothetical protein